MVYAISRRKHFFEQYIYKYAFYFLEYLFMKTVYYEHKLRINWKRVRVGIGESLGRTRSFTETIYLSIALTPIIIE